MYKILIDTNILYDKLYQENKIKPWLWEDCKNKKIQLYVSTNSLFEIYDNIYRNNNSNMIIELAKIIKDYEIGLFAYPDQPVISKYFYQLDSFGSEDVFIEELYKTTIFRIANFLTYVTNGIMISLAYKIESNKNIEFYNQVKIVASDATFFEDVNNFWNNELSKSYKSIKGGYHSIYSIIEEILKGILIYILSVKERSLINFKDVLHNISKKINGKKFYESAKKLDVKLLDIRAAYLQGTMSNENYLFLTYSIEQYISKSAKNNKLYNDLIDFLNFRGAYSTLDFFFTKDKNFYKRMNQCFDNEPFYKNYILKSEKMLCNYLA